MMDVLVFLTLAMLICGVQMAQLHSEISAGNQSFKDDARSNPSDMLHALLGTSIGRTLTLNTVPEVIVRSEAKVADCLAMEALGLVEGRAIHAFDEMNTIVLSIAINATAPLMWPGLMLDMIDDEGRSRLLSIGRCEGTGGDSYAASCELITQATSTIVVSLVLLPALLPEALCV